MEEQDEMGNGEKLDVELSLRIMEPPMKEVFTDEFNAEALKIWDSIRRMENSPVGGVVHPSALMLRKMLYDKLRNPVEKLMGYAGFRADSGLYIYNVPGHRDVAIAFSVNGRMHALLYDNAEQGFNFYTI